MNIVTNNTLLCTRCRRVKDAESEFTEFGRAKRWCKECVSVYNKRRAPVGVGIRYGRR